jgi:hypothetical protein
MGVFDDQKFDSLDWLSQAVEPIETDLMVAFGAIPDELEINFRTFNHMLGSSSYNLDLSAERALRWLMSSYAPNRKPLTYKEKEILVKAISFEVEPNTVIDYENNEIRGGIKFIKKANLIDEKELIPLIGEAGLVHLDHIRITENSMQRMTEVLEMLGSISNEAMRSRSPRGRLRTIKDRVEEIFRKDEWRIRTPDLGTKIGLWLRQYIMDGNLAAWSNFCRLKLMTHQGRAIYSIQEVV